MNGGFPPVQNVARPRAAEFAESDMRLRSLLFVPGDSERKFARARDCGADALILDLEDSVAASEKANARSHVAGLIEPGRNAPGRSSCASMRSTPA